MEREEKLVELGSRNFFLWPKSETTADGGGAKPASNCSKEADKCRNKDLSWLRFMSFLL